MTALADRDTDVAQRPGTKQALVLSFSGYFHEEGGFVFAACDHAGIVTHGETAEIALASIPRGIVVYLRALQDRGELELAIQARKLHVRLAEINPEEWATPQVTTIDDRWIVEMAAF